MRIRRAGVVGGTASAGALAAVGAARAVKRTVDRRKPDPFADENFGLIDDDRARTVIAPDGVALAVRECGPADAPVTVVFSHGFSNRMTSFHLQRTHLAEVWGADARLVFHDLRGHGHSGQPDAEHCTIEELGSDLAAVVAAVAPEGPVVLVGHSMGGMSILAAARQFPDLFDERVIGVALLSTSAAGIAKTGLGRNLAHPALDGFRVAVRVSPALVQFGRVSAQTLIRPILHAASFRTNVSPAIARFTYAMIDATPVTTVVKFLKTLELHDESEALAHLHDIPVLVLSGDSDLVIPFSAAEKLAEALSEAEVIRVHRGGHMVHLEFPEIVNEALVELLERATATGKGRSIRVG